MISLTLTGTRMRGGVKKSESTARGGAVRGDGKDRGATAVRWYRSTAGLGILGAGAMWLALPPVDFGVLGWVAPVCWLILIRQHELHGRRPYVVLYLVGAVFWAVTFYWLNKPHWSASFGWVAMFVYLAWYIVLFVGLSRVAVHQLRVPLVVAAPVVWTGLELVRAHFVTGFLMAALAHTQYRWISLIQISDLVGSYGVSFLVMFVAACLTTALPLEKAPMRRWPLAAAGLAIAAALAYGHWRANEQPGPEGPRIALIQGSIDTQFGLDPIEQRNIIYNQYMRLSYNALLADPDVELLVWPESMYIVPFLLIDEDAYLPAEVVARWPRISAEDASRMEAERKLPERVLNLRDLGHDWFRRTMADLALVAPDTRNKPSGTDGGPSLLVGTDCEHYRPGYVDRYNTSVYLDSEGRVREYYHKMHPVMFGEYVPLGEVFPALYQLTPLQSGLTAGLQPKTYDVSGTLIAPNICYETVLPHVIRRQVRMLRESGREPDVLLTQTNDGWFWGSAALDMHLICGVFRAVECRKPLLIAANTGLSASIDADGRILERGPRQDTDFLLVRPRIDRRHSVYVDAGDWFAWLCAACCAGLAATGLLRWRNSLRPSSR